MANALRSVEDMIAGRNAPIAPAAPAPALLTALTGHQCRFPVGHDAAGARFCGASIPADRWLPGKSMGSYCQLHRDYLRGCPSVWDEGRINGRGGES